MEEDEIDSFLSNFENTQNTKRIKEEASNAPIKEEQLQDYVTEKINQLATISIESIQDVKDLAIASNDGETISALAALIAASTKQLEVLSKISLAHIKIKSSEKMQEKSHAHKEKIVERKHEQLKELGGADGNTPQLLQQNNVYINATREEILDHLVADIKKTTAEQKKIIDI